jgi:uncharacterized protein
MNALAFDTLAYTRRMEEAGFTRQQAEALADEQAKLIDERLATKTDIEALRLANKADMEAIHRDIERLRLETKSDIEALRLANKSDIEALRLANKSEIEGLRLANKSETEGLRLATQSDIAASRDKTEILIERVRSDILKWTIGAIGLQTVAVLAAVYGLARMLAH